MQLYLILEDRPQSPDDEISESSVMRWLYCEETGHDESENVGETPLDESWCDAFLHFSDLYPSRFSRHDMVNVFFLLFRITL
jgi:hypothetical protein